MGRFMRTLTRSRSCRKLRSLTDKSFLQVAPGATVRDLIGDLGLAERKGVAVAINGAVIPRAGWPERGLVSEDRILVIQATQGG